MSTDELTFVDPETRLPTCPCCRDVQERSEYAERTDDGRRLFVCPTCGRAFRPTDSLSVFHELYDTLAMHRRGVHADRMVAGLLRYECETRELVGVVEGASQAVFFESERHLIVAVRFDAHGVHDRVEAMLTGDVADVEAWLEFHAADLLWIHPRYEQSVIHD